MRKGIGVNCAKSIMYDEESDSHTALVAAEVNKDWLRIVSDPIQHILFCEFGLYNSLDMH